MRLVVAMKYFVVLLLIVCSLPALRAQHPAAEMGFGFENPGGSTTYSWEVFRNAFYGVPVDSSTGWFTAPFDMIFYTEAIRSKMANPAGDTVRGAGRCFGWSTAGAMMWKYGGYRGFCGPPVRYVGADPVTGNPVEPGLTRVIEITQIQQLTLANVQGIIDQTIGGHSQQATYAYPRIREGIERDGAVIIGVTKTLDPLTGAAHALIGYEIIDSTVSLKKVMVVDPNRSWGIDTDDDRGWYERNENFVLLDLGSDKWSFRMAGANFDWPVDGSSRFDSAESAQIAAGTTDSATVIAAHPVSVGHLIAYPLALAGMPGRTPTSLGLGVTQLLTKFWIYNEEGTGARVVQLADSDGRRLFDPTTGNVDTDATSGLVGTAPWFPMMSREEADPLPFSLWFHRGIMTEGTLDIATGTGPMHLTFGSNRGLVRVSSDGGNEAQLRLDFAGIGTTNPRVTVLSASAPVTLDIELLVPVRAQTTNRRYRLTSLPVRPGSSNITFEADRYGTISYAGVPSDGSSRISFLQESHGADRTIFGIPMVPATSDGMIAIDAWKEEAKVVGEGDSRE